MSSESSQDSSTKSSLLKQYQIDLIDKAMSCGALKFGSFTLKSGRISPYFFNAGLLSTGPILAVLSEAFAATIVAAQQPQLTKDDNTPIPPFDVLFGPAYKGIAFAATTSLVLHTHYRESENAISNSPETGIGFAYNRKELKPHGEGGSLVGCPVSNKQVVILDDVMTAGTAVREAIEIVRGEGGEVVGVIQLLDREEVGKDGSSSTVDEVESIIGKGRVKSILRMRDLIEWLKTKEMTQELETMEEYRIQYGLKR
ncbi:orotate phosphoribosyltransferase [Lentinula aciculospora]|uniref:orotate phosphoribosyltransferase n=1 Tax=Lentinula aciculospora TaxID=153920 RepID=A0A9W8ZW09_9AGAR|nr:orotate phosphoribosyltransferase [Lentinula aciculospora]